MNDFEHKQQIYKNYKLICILLPDFRGGGVEQVRIQLGKSFIEQGFAVEYLVCSAKGEFLEEAQIQCPITSLDISNFRNIIFPLVKYLRDKKPDILLVAMWPLTVIAPLVKLFPKVNTKIIVSEHCILSQQYKDWGKKHRFLLKLSSIIGYRLADTRIAVSRGVAQDMSALAKLPVEHISVINNPLRLLNYPTEQELKYAEFLWQRPRGQRILSVGTLKEQKNHALLLYAFAKLSLPQSCLMLVGRGHLEKELCSLAEELKIINKIIFAGFHANPAPFYHTADLFVLSSDDEGFGNVIVEALACGLPVISTDCPSGPREILEDGKYGKLVPVGDADALAAAMLETLTNPPDPNFLKQRAADFSVEKIAKQYLSVMFPDEY